MVEIDDSRCFLDETEYHLQQMWDAGLMYGTRTAPGEPALIRSTAPGALRQAWARHRRRLPWLATTLVLHALLLTVFLWPRRAPPPSTPPVPLETQIITEPRVTPAPPPLKTLALVLPTAQIAVPTPLVSIPDPAAVAATVRPTPTTSAVRAVRATSRARPAPAQPITPPQFDAAYLHNPSPWYPFEARRVREQGTVMLEVEVSPRGLALEVLIEHSSGWRLLDEAALSAVERWRFVPARQGGDPVAAWVLVPIQFELRS